MDRDRLPTSRESRTSNGGLGLVFAGALAGIVVTVFAVVFLVDSLSWDWQRLTGSDSPNLIEAWRNIGLIALGAVGIGLATWRSMIAHRQTRTAVEQRRISERGLNVDRYQKGAAMLESEELPVRIAGIYGLRELAMSDPEESYILVQSVLFAFVRETSNNRKKISDNFLAKNADAFLYDVSHGYEKLSPAVHEALEAAILSRRSIQNSSTLEAISGWEPNLRSVNFSDESFVLIDFSGVILTGSDFRGAFLKFAEFRKAVASRTDFSGAHLIHIDFSFSALWRSCFNNAFLENVNISHANLNEVESDEDTAFNDVWAWADRPPINMPPEIAAVITYRDPAERKEGE